MPTEISINYSSLATASGISVLNDEKINAFTSFVSSSYSPTVIVLLPEFRF